MEPNGLTMQDAYSPEDLKDELDVNDGVEADSINFVTVPGEDHVFLYLWDTERDAPVHSIVGFTADGMEKLQDWLTNVDIEARNAPINEYGDSE